MNDSEAQFSAKFTGFAAGPPSDAPVGAVRDVIVCVVAPGSVETGPGEYQMHPPIASPAILRDEGAAPPVELGRGVRIDRLSHDDEELVRNACSPRGHYFVPVHQFGQRYSLVRDVDLALYEEHPFHWDEEGTLWDALSLMRLVRDNGYSTEYAARITDYVDGAQRVMYTLTAESKIAYRLRRDREWLDPHEGAQLRDLLGAYWAAGELPARVRRAMWRAEYASWLKWGDLVVSMLAGGLEALLKTERHESTRQFVTRVPALAADVGVGGVDRASATECTTLVPRGCTAPTCVSSPPGRSQRKRRGGKTAAWDRRLPSSGGSSRRSPVFRTSCALRSDGVSRTKHSSDLRR